MLYGRMVCISRLQISSPSRTRKIITMVLGMSDIAAGAFSYTAHARGTSAIGTQDFLTLSNKNADFSTNYSCGLEPTELKL